jgi:hypothetical protein
MEPFIHTKMRSNISLTIALCICFALIINVKTCLGAEAGGAGFLFLELPLNPRAIGMGSAGTAAADGGFAYYNPALIAYAPGGLTRVEYGQIPGDLNQTHLESAWRLGDNYYAAADWHFWSISGIIPSTEQGMAPYAQGTSQDTRVSLLAAYRFHSVSFGLALNGIQERIFTNTAYGVSFSAGAATAFLNDKLRVGLAAFHEGAATTFLAFPRDWRWSWQENRMPRSARLGLAWNDSLKTISYTVALDGVYRDENETFFMPLGLQIKPTPYLALRCGKRLNFNHETVNCGLGIVFAPLSFDCSFAFTDIDADPSWWLGLTYALAHP